MKIKSSNFVNLLSDWACKYDINTIHMWPKFVKVYLNELGWNKKSIQDFISEYPCEHNSKDYSIEDFYGDAHYCCDRMSLCRLTRIHKMYKHITIFLDRLNLSKEYRSPSDCDWYCNNAEYIIDKLIKNYFYVYKFIYNNETYYVANYEKEKIMQSFYYVLNKHNIYIESVNELINVYDDEIFSLDEFKELFENNKSKEETVYDIHFKEEETVVVFYINNSTYDEMQMICSRIHNVDWKKENDIYQIVTPINNDIREVKKNIRKYKDI